MVKRKQMWPLIFLLQVKYETWSGFGLRKPNANDDSFCPKNKQVNVVNSVFGFFTTGEWNRSSKQWGKLYMSIEISQMFSTLNHSQMSKKLHTWYQKMFALYKIKKNVSYSKLKLNTFSLLKLFEEFSQFLSRATKVSNKIYKVNETYL